MKTICTLLLLALVMFSAIVLINTLKDAESTVQVPDEPRVYSESEIQSIRLKIRFLGLFIALFAGTIWAKNALKTEKRDMDSFHYYQQNGKWPEKGPWPK